MKGLGMQELRKKKLKRMLQESRFRLVHRNSDFAKPLYDMLFVAVKDVQWISTNGSCIYFDPDWLLKLGDTELDFILSHQLMHIRLGHINRPKYYLGDRYHLAADIVANANLQTLGWNVEKLPHIGKIYCTTFLPTVDGRLLTSEEAIRCVPFDPSRMKPSERRRFMIDSETWWDKKDDRGESGTIVLSPEDKDPEDLGYGGESYGSRNAFCMEIFPHTEGEETEQEPPEDRLPNRRQPSDQGNQEQLTRELLNDLRKQRRQDAKAGLDEDFTERSWLHRRTSRLDWRKLIDIFIQEDLCDYSFTPPDRRMQNYDFFLPDYQTLPSAPKNILFMVDTSASISEGTLSLAYSEIAGAIEQFGGALTGTIAFFDLHVHKSVPFAGIENLKKITPQGGGGTDYRCIFEYIHTKMAAQPPASVIIITDGDADFPEEESARGLPVLWLLTEADSHGNHLPAPWGKSAVIS